MSRFNPTQDEIERARNFYSGFIPPKGSLTEKIIQGWFGKGGIDRLVLRKAREYAMDRVLA